MGDGSTTGFMVVGMDEGRHRDTSPIGGLATTFAVGAGAVRSTALAAIVLLGLLIAALAVRGLDDRVGFRHPTQTTGD